VFEWHQHGVIDALAVSLRVAAALLSLDNRCAGLFTVGREFWDRTDHQCWLISRSRWFMQQRPIGYAPPERIAVMCCSA